MLKSLLAISVLAACSSTTTTAKPPAPVAVVAPVPDDTVIELAARRAQLIGWLHDYREAGAFPIDALGMPASVFKDQSGVRCPMAELLHKAGRDDLVDAVAKEANGVRLADVHAGPLHAWMLSSGLTEQEIAMVQGAMNISMTWMPEENPEHERIFAGRAAVRAKLEIAEIALRDNTAASLAAAAKRLDGQKVVALASMPIHGAVVPAAAIPAPGVVQLPPRVRYGMRGGRLVVE